MKLTQRIQRLERAGVYARPLSPFERFSAALDDAARRLTGRDFRALAEDDPAWGPIFEEATARCCREMSYPDRKVLEEELAQRAFGDDVAARAAADRRAEALAAELVGRW